MEAVRQVYEKLPETITMPSEMRNHRAEVIILPLESEPEIAALETEFGIKPEEVADPEVLQFSGSIPDFPPCAPQEEYEVRPELDLLRELDEQDLEAKAARFGLKLEDVADLHALKFIGSLPDFSPRAPQGEYEDRPELDLL